MLRLGVNIDHAATLRQARYGGDHLNPRAEPDPVAIARAAESAGAHCITVHLREDRRHIQDADVERLREAVRTRLNLEMANTPAIADFALGLRPDEVCIVPERRQEVTTEGGLDAVGQEGALRPTIERFRAAGIRVSLFIEPDERQITVAHDLGAEMVELHTGAFSSVDGDAVARELHRLVDGAVLAHRLGLQVNAGHGINYTNIEQILTIPHLNDLNIGHSILARALVVGIGQAVSEMLARMGNYPHSRAEDRAR